MFPWILLFCVSVSAQAGLAPNVTTSSCLSCTANAVLPNHGRFCLNIGSCVNRTSSCSSAAATNRSCDAGTCCIASIEDLQCSLFGTIGACRRLENCGYDWVRASEGARGCENEPPEFRCCVKRPKACTFFGNVGTCVRQEFCASGKAWMLTSAGAVGCVTEPPDVRCCTDNTPRPNGLPPTPTRPPTLTSTLLTAVGTPAPGVVGSPAPATPPRTSVLQTFTTNAGRADCAAVGNCSPPGGVCVQSGVCACKLPLIATIQGCVEPQRTDTLCHVRPCSTNATAPFCAVFNGDAYCFTAESEFAPRLVEDATSSAPSGTPDSSDPTTVVVAVVVSVIAVVALIGSLVLFLVWRKRRINSRRRESSATATKPTPKAPHAKRAADDGAQIVMKPAGPALRASPSYKNVLTDGRDVSTTIDSPVTPTAYASMPGTTTAVVAPPNYANDQPYVGDKQQVQPLF